MKFTKYGTGPHTFYETPVINGIRATIHGVHSIDSFYVNHGSRYKITIAKDVSDMKDFEVYQVMLSDRLTTAKELAEHFLNVWAANAGKVA